METETFHWPIKSPNRLTRCTIPTTSHVRKFASGTNHSLVLTEHNRLFAFGKSCLKKYMRHSRQQQQQQWEMQRQYSSSSSGQKYDPDHPYDYWYEVTRQQPSIQSPQSPIQQQSIRQSSSSPLPKSSHNHNHHQQQQQVHAHHQPLPLHQRTRSKSEHDQPYWWREKRWDHIDDIECGGFYSLVLVNGGKELWGGGCNSNGELGHDRSYDVHDWALLLTVSQLVHQCKIEMSLRRESSSSILSPSTMIDFDVNHHHSQSRITHMTAGYYFHVIVLDNRYVFTCGENTSMQLCRRRVPNGTIDHMLRDGGNNNNDGNGNNNNNNNNNNNGNNSALSSEIERSDFQMICNQQVLNGRNILEVRAGFRHWILLTTRNELFGCGSNEFYQLAINHHSASGHGPSTSSGGIVQVLTKIDLSLSPSPIGGGIGGMGNARTRTLVWNRLLITHNSYFSSVLLDVNNDVYCTRESELRDLHWMNRQRQLQQQSQSLLPSSSLSPSAAPPPPHEMMIVPSVLMHHRHRRNHGDDDDDENDDQSSSPTTTQSMPSLTPHDTVQYYNSHTVSLFVVNGIRLYSSHASSSALSSLASSQQPVLKPLLKYDNDPDCLGVGGGSGANDDDSMYYYTREQASMLAQQLRLKRHEREILHVGVGYYGEVTLVVGRPKERNIASKYFPFIRTVMDSGYEPLSDVDIVFSA